MDSNAQSSKPHPQRFPGPRNPYRSAAEAAPAAAAQRLLEVYRIAIGAAQNRQPEGVLQCLALLRSTLDARPSPEIALSLAAIYADIESAVNAEDFATATALLVELQAVWQARINAEFPPV